MITLITGVPGSGKTLSVVSDLAKKINNEWKDRKIFIEGIPELTIETTPIPEGHSINDMHVWLQYPENNGSVVIIDEAQNVFPPRSPAVKAPPLVEWLHVHRHSGIDIILITQMPQRIDKHVRDLVGAHYHIHKTRWAFLCVIFGTIVRIIQGQSSPMHAPKSISWIKRRSGFINQRKSILR
ncbi:zonular occludens toxin domain-containing protein [Neisseria meningitidis]|uniref:zonular occludens toxin domain-containing protein n=1 Tax=Neisseria meningitidis TaxID=487 RepID=UPI001E531FB4|nr:zonular occludens toxin domain-containing protein [Neisseria meningitidis]